MARYHINPHTGNPGICRASNSCPFGDFETDHYNSSEQARADYEKKVTSGEIRFTAPKKMKKMTGNELKGALTLEMNVTQDQYLQIMDAVKFAEILHEGQIRKEEIQGRLRTPYIEHPLRNALRLARLNVTDTDVFVGALLHDVVEDCAHKYSSDLDPQRQQKQLLDQIFLRYGDRATLIIKGVTTPPRPQGVNKNEHYAATIRHEMRMGEGVFLVKYSDFVDNAGSLHWMDPVRLDKAQGLARKYFPTVPIFREGLEGNRGALEAQIGSQCFDKIARRLDIIEKNLAEILN